MKDEKKLIKIFYDWRWYENRLKTLREKVKMMSCSITACYGMNAGGSSGFSSKIERYLLEKETIEKEIKSIEKNIKSAIRAFNKADLSPIEKKIIQHIMKGGSLATFAKDNDIYISNVYKIRDRSIAKIMIHINL